MNYEIGDETKCAICGNPIVLYLTEQGEEWTHKDKTLYHRAILKRRGISYTNLSMAIGLREGMIESTLKSNHLGKGEFISKMKKEIEKIQEGL